MCFLSSVLSFGVDFIREREVDRPLLCYLKTQSSDFHILEAIALFNMMDEARTSLLE